MAEEKSVSEKSDKAQSEENRKVRAAQSKAGNVFLSERKEYEIIKDSRHLKKGEKVRINAPTAEVFRAKGLIK